MWIKNVPVDKAVGIVKREYDAGKKRTGRISSIVKCMSLNPAVLQSSIKLYKSVMFGRSPLSRIQRELLATVVAVELDCHY